MYNEKWNWILQYSRQGLDIYQISLFISPTEFQQTLMNSWPLNHFHRSQLKKITHQSVPFRTPSPYTCSHFPTLSGIHRTASMPMQGPRQPM